MFNKFIYLDLFTIIALTDLVVKIKKLWLYLNAFLEKNYGLLKISLF